jgi:predicted DNA-binding transcriptional regulator AlpA
MTDEIQLLIGGEESLNLQDVCKITGITMSKLYELLRYDLFPNPIRIGRKNFWKKSDIEAYLESKKINASEPKPEKNKTADE